VEDPKPLLFGIPVKPPNLSSRSIGSQRFAGEKPHAACLFPGMTKEIRLENPLDNFFLSWY